MNIQSSCGLWKEHLKYQGYSALFFLAFFGVLYMVERLFPSVSLLELDSAAFWVGIPSSVFGVGYVLTIRNPHNYTGFYGACAMAVLLAVQMYLYECYGMALFYIFLYLPFSIYSLITWKKPGDDTKGPSLFGLRYRIYLVLVFAALTALDTMVEAHYVPAYADAPLYIPLLSALQMAGAFFGNVLLINKKIEAWICWIINNVTGIIYFIWLDNLFGIVLFSVFCFVNIQAYIAWHKLMK